MIPFQSQLIQGISLVLAGTTFLSDSSIVHLGEASPGKGALLFSILSTASAVVADPVSGDSSKRLISANGQMLRVWANYKGIPIITVDPSLLDSSLFEGWYQYWTEIPLSGGFLSEQVGDINGNGLPEMYGTHKDFETDFSTRVYEVDPSGIPLFLNEYLPRPGPSRAILDSDNDSFLEVAFTLGGDVTIYEQQSRYEIPLEIMLVHDRYQGNVSNGYTGIYFGSLDGDSLLDFLYRGSEIDSSDTSHGITKTYVTEFNADSGNFCRAWSTPDGSEGFAVDDFDRDGFAEFLSAEWFGRIYVTENLSNDEYAVVWEDSLPYVNTNYMTSGDVDGDGYSEFFIGATLGDGNWTVAFEADGNNTYSPRVIFNLLSAGLFDVPDYYVTDLDGNSFDDLIIKSGTWLFVFTSSQDNEYKLAYYWDLEDPGPVQFYDLNGDHRLDFVIGRTEFDQFGRHRLYSQVFLRELGTSLSIETSYPTETGLNQNYPNPFNSSTLFSFHTSTPQIISLRVFTLEGRLVQTVYSGQTDVGTHQVNWDATRFATGVYVAMLATGRANYYRKIVLVR